MRFVNCSPLNIHGLEQANQNPPQTRQQATSRWSSFGYKSEVLTFLLRQQYQLCCYSELRADIQQVSYHIEHVENKSQCPHRTFDETNLAASALSSDDISTLLRADVFGGHAVDKQKGVDMTRFISCYHSHCAHYFSYLSDGRIIPSINLDDAERAKAKYTIDLLNLDSNYLKKSATTVVGRT